MTTQQKDSISTVDRRVAAAVTTSRGGPLEPTPYRLFLRSVVIPFSPGRLAGLAAMVAAVYVMACAGDGTDRDEPDLEVYHRIRDEGLKRSRVMEHAAGLVDGIGPRLTGSPALERAVVWSMDRLRALGASNVRRESWGEFGAAWELRNVWARMVAPYPSNFVATAGPWSPGTLGPIEAEVVAVRGFGDESGFGPLRGTLRGRIVLLGRAASAPVVTPIDRPLFERFDDAQLAALARDERAGTGPSESEALEQAFAFAEFGERMSRFFGDEGVLAVMVPSGNNARGGASGGTIYGDWNSNLGAYAYQKSRAMAVPLVIVAVEEYLRMSRLLERGVPVRVELNVDVAPGGDVAEGFNVLADVPGNDDRRRQEIVMATAHLDSWAVGTGATDNGAGVAVVMEALRILTAIGARPARTIRAGLWTGEEQGLLGSLAYVARHVAQVPRAATPAQLRVPEAFRTREGSIVPRFEHGRISAVFNIDNGSGRIRGVTASGHAALVPLVTSWIAPLSDLGVSVVSARQCGGDCRPFLDAGIPALSFIQDPLDYDTRTHHMSGDTYDHLIHDDLRQASVVLAALLYNTAMRDELLPRGAEAVTAPR